MLVKKDGFANYYFNQVEQDRTLKGMKDLGDFASVGGAWTLTGKNGEGQDFTAKISDKLVELKWAGKDYTQDLTTAEF